jgi:hypothetical protein
MNRIFNNESIANYIATVNADARGDPDAYVARCDVIELDTEKMSKEGDVYVNVELDHIGPIQIHCQHLSESRT